MLATATSADHSFVFIGGLHRSGTTLFHDLLTRHPRISGLTNTHVPMNEGQFLQDVFSPEGRYRKIWPIRHVRRLGLQRIAEKGYGGPGRFAFDVGAHLTEESPLVSRATAERIFTAWTPYWDTGVPYLAEKSPPNLIRMRFLQALFPDSYFIAIRRHPVAVSLATQRAWREHTSLFSLFRHWVHAHEIFEGDRPHLKRALSIVYEELLSEPRRILNEVYRFLDLDQLDSVSMSELDPGINEKYFRQWRKLESSRFGRKYAGLLRRSFSAPFDKWGYTLDV